MASYKMVTLVLEDEKRSRNRNRGEIEPIFTDKVGKW